MTILLYAIIVLAAVAGWLVSRSEDAQSILRDSARICARWVFWSPRHAAVAVGASVGLLAAAGMLTSGH